MAARIQPVGVAGVARLPERELVSRARTAGEPELAMSAIRELVARRSPKRAAILRTIVADDECDLDLRALAAVELGHDASAANRALLSQLLTTTPPAVARRAAEGLGRIGDRSSFTRLRRLRPRDPVVLQAVEFARTLLSYRLGLDQDLLDAPPPRRLTTAKRSAPMEIDFAEPSKAVTEQALAAAAREFPAMRLSVDGALHFECNNDQFFVAFDRDVHRRKNLAPLSEHNAVLLTVMKRPASLQRYAAYLYVLTHPERDGRLRLFGVRPSGRIVLTGEADIDGATADFRVGSLPTPHLVPLTVEARYDNDVRRISFVTTVIEADFAPGQKAPKRPTRSGLPPG